MNQSVLKRLQPHLIACLVFLGITVVYFLPLFQGKQLSQHDIAQWLGMSKEIIDFRESTGTEALWTNSMFGGMPAYQISVVYASNLMSYVNSILTLWLPQPANYLFLCLLGFYLLLISLKADFRLAIAGAIAYAFCSYFFVVIVAGHNSKAHAIALMPMVIAGVLMTYRGRYLLGGALTALALSLQIYANHLQITYYLAIAIGLLVIAELIQSIIEKRISNFTKASAVLAIGAVLAVMPNITNILATYEYGEYTTRGASELTAKKVSTGLDKDYATGWSYGKLETMTLLIPDFKGGSSTYALSEKSATFKAINEKAGEQQARDFVKSAPLYWGDQPMTSGPVYNGAIIFFLFVLGMMIIKGNMRWWLLSVTVLSIMLAWGKNFPELTDFFFNNFPGYNKFRAVSMTLVLASLTLPFAAMLAVMSFTSGGIDKDILKKKLLYAFYITGGFCLLFVLVPTLFCSFNGLGDEQLKQYDWLLIALKQDRESILRTDAFRSFFFIAVAFGMMWFWLKDKIKTQYLFIGLAFFIIVDMWMVDKRYLSDKNFVSKSKAERPFDKTAADEQILLDTSYYRVMNTTLSTFNDASTSYFHKSIGGYHGAKLKRYQELIEGQISKSNMNVLNMLNAKYFIVQNEQAGQPIAQQNPGALGNAWFVNSWKIVKNADQEMAALDSLNTRSEAVIDERFVDEVKGLAPGIDSTGTIKLTKYSPNALSYTSSASKDQLAVFSDIYYPEGWNAYVDGKPASHIRLNYVLRGMKIPSGNHSIDFKFEPTVYKNGERIALASSIVLLLLVGFACIREAKQE